VRWAIYPNQAFMSEAKKRSWQVLQRPKHFIEEKKFTLKKN